MPFNINWKKWAIWLGVILFLIIAIYLAFSKHVKRPDIITPPNDNPNGGNQPKYDPTALTDALYQDYDEYWGALNIAPWQQFLSLSDNAFVIVCNDWNARYYSKADKMSLRQAMEDNSFFFADGSMGVLSSWDGIKVSLRSKFDRLGLK